MAHISATAQAQTTSDPEVPPPTEDRRPLPIVWLCCPHCTPRGPTPLLCQHCGQEFISPLDGPFHLDRSALLDWILSLQDLLRDMQGAIEEGRR